jgi:hypothetical protein
MPHHWVSGQIPLRSRILRVALDFFRLVDGGGRSLSSTPAQAVEQMRDYQGTWYDPLALVHLESVALDRPREDWHSTRQRVGIDQLAVGMVLASDLCTSSGIKLLARGATISSSTLDVITRRHLADPIIDGVWVQRRA